MKKTLLLLMSLVTFYSFAQKKDKSPSFEEPEGWCKLVQLPNSNTCFLEFTKKEGINVILYDSLRKKVGSGKLTTKLIDDKLGIHILNGIYSINGDVVVFFQKAEDRTPIMIRLVIDGTTGKLKSEEKIAELDRISTKDAYSLAFGGMDMPDIRIVKDPESDYYALIRYNVLASETKDRIEIFHYSPDHKIINKANYTDPSAKYKYTNYLNAYVHKDEYVVIGTYAYNTKKSGGEEGRFFISKLANGKTKFVQKELPFTDYFKYPSAMFVFNKVKGIIHMIVITNASSSGDENSYTFNFQNFTPATLNLEKPYRPDFSKVNAYYTGNMGSKTDFQGMMQGSFVDKSGNLILMYQGTTTKSSNGMVTGTFLSDVALLTMSPEGKTINSAVFPFYSFVSGDHSAFNSDKIKTGFRPANNFDDGGLANEQYFAIDLISTETANYLLFNNIPKNVETDEKESIKLLKGISGATAVKYTFSGNAIKRDYLFKKPKDKSDVEFCNFSSSSYNPVKKSYATIVTDPETKKSAVVWIKLD